jgi:hypothetical protein
MSERMYYRFSLALPLVAGAMWAALTSSSDPGERGIRQFVLWMALAPYGPRRAAPQAHSVRRPAMNKCSMRNLLTPIAVLWQCLGHSVSAQSAGESLTVRRLPGSITFVLPASWAPLSDSARARIGQVMDTTFEHSRDTLLQASLRYGKPMVLLHEAARGAPDPSASFNAAPSPGTTTSGWDAATPDQITSALAFLCGSVTQMLAQLGARVITCDPARVDRKTGHTIAITRLVRSGPKGFVTVWLAQYPAKDVIYTLTLSAPRAQEARYSQLFETIWRSVKIPSP